MYKAIVLIVLTCNEMISTNSCIIDLLFWVTFSLTCLNPLFSKFLLLFFLSTRESMKSSICNTLLVSPEKLVPPCNFRRYPSNQYFRHTEARPHTCTTLTKAICGSYLNQGIRWIVDVIIEIQEEIQTLRKSKYQI